MCILRVLLTFMPYFISFFMKCCDLFIFDNTRTISQLSNDIVLMDIELNHWPRYLSIYVPSAMAAVSWHQRDRQKIARHFLLALG